MEDESTIILTLWKTKLINKMKQDNKTKYFNEQIDRGIYEHNRLIIETIETYKDKLTLRQIEDKTKQLIGFD